MAMIYLFPVWMRVRSTLFILHKQRRNKQIKAIPYSQYNYKKFNFNLTKNYFTFTLSSFQISSTYS